MSQYNFSSLFSNDMLNRLFPIEKTDQFFHALFGDSEEGAYNINLYFKEYRDNKLHFEFHLTRRQGKCLVCSLTYGLPKVFEKHPVINIKGIVNEIENLLEKKFRCNSIQIENTIQVSKDLHVIPFIVVLENSLTKF
ncbi:MAG: pancreas/duodenum homeobox protein 1 [Desulfobacterales bacterium]|nr:pancreas/duodenum homeobox protein 1 [Desulfobacterales bacterium]